MVSHDDDQSDDVVLTEGDVSLYCGDANQGCGTLFVKESILLWKDDNKSVSFYYQSISLHAISRDTNRFPHECIYCLVESEPIIETEDTPPEERDSEVPVSEIRFVPQNSESIQSIYDAITTCQELNPDPNEDFSEEEDTNEEYYEAMEPSSLTEGIDMSGFYTAESNLEDIQLSEEGQQVLQRLQENMRISEENNLNGHKPTEQFEDADE